MRAFRRKHLSDRDLLRNLAERLDHDRINTAELLADVAEVDRRRLYLPAGLPSMYLFCVRELHMSEDVAYMRIRAARAARRFPAIFELVADGRLHLTAVVLLAPRLTRENAVELLTAGVHKTKWEIKELLAQRFPQPDVPPRVVALPVAAPARGQLGLDPVGGRTPESDAASGRELGLDPVAPPVPTPGLTPVVPERYALQVTIGRDTYEKLCHAEALLSHSIPSGDLAAVLDRLLDLGIVQLEKRKFCATRRPRPRRRRSSANPRHVPAQVKRAVWERDGGRCTYVSEDGHRCPARKFLECDHVEPVARGGQATVAGLRLRCRAHNQYEAERTYGSDYMKAKREAARRERAAAAEARARAATAEAQARAGHASATAPIACPAPGSTTAPGAPPA